MTAQTPGGRFASTGGESIDRSRNCQVIYLDLGRYGEQQREPSIAGFDGRKRFTQRKRCTGCMVSIWVKYIGSLFPKEG